MVSGADWWARYFLHLSVSSDSVYHQIRTIRTREHFSDRLRAGDIRYEYSNPCGLDNDSKLIEIQLNVLKGLR